MQDASREKVCPVCRKLKEFKSNYLYVTCAECRNITRSSSRVNNPIPYMLMAARTRAKRLGIPFNITAEDIIIPEVCPILGIPLRMSPGSRGASRNSPALDRIIPALGYVRGNVQVISSLANAMKQDATLDEIIRLGTWAQRVKTHGVLNTWASLT